MSKEPTGFPNRTDSTISFNNGSRTFSIAPTGSFFEFFVVGVKYIKSTTQSVVITNTEGLWYFYFDNTGTLQATNVFTSAIIREYAFVAALYWDATNAAAIYFAEERHGLTMDGATHSYLHNSIGAVYLSGYALGDFTVDDNGSLASHAQLSCANGTFYDEDLQHTTVNGSPQTLSPIAQIPIYYRTGSGAGVWRRKAADTYPVIYSGTAGYTGPNGRLPFNQNSGGVWSLAELPNFNYVLVHYFATNNINEPIVGIHGITSYNSISDARTGASSEISSVTGLPFSEFVPLGSVIFQTDSYTNVPNARIRSTDTGQPYVDFRPLGELPLGSVSSHSNLSDLDALDHPASAIYTSTTNFNNILSSANTTVQSALDALDNIIPVTDGDKGDITVSASGATWTIDNAAVTNAKLANVATATIKGRTTAGTGSPEDLTTAQATALLDVFTSTLKGLAPSSGGGTTNYLRADGTWAVPPGGGGVTDGDKGDITVSSGGGVWTIDNTVVTNAKLANVATATFKGRTTAGSGSPEDLTGTQATALLDVFTSTLKGLAPSSGGGTANYLRADGTWAAPPGSFTQAAADLLYLKLDTSNGPLTNTLTINKTTPSLTAPTLTTASANDLFISAASGAGSRGFFISSATATSTDNGITITGSAAAAANRTSVLVSTPVSTAADRFAFRVTNNTGDIMRLNGLSQTLVADGTAANPSLAFINSVGTGVYRPAADQLAIATAGAQRLLVTSTGFTIGAFTLPLTDGTANQVLRTNGSGSVTWQTITATIADGDKGDITVSSSGSVWTIDNTVVTNAKLADVATATIKGRTTAGSGSPEDLTGAQATALLDVFSSSLKGLAPASGGGTANFLRADGTWAAPSASVADGDKGDITVSSSGSVWTIDNTVVTNAKLANVSTATIKGRTTAGSGSPEDLTGTQATALLDVFTSSLKGLAPASGGGTTAFLRADGTWSNLVTSGTAAPSGGNDGDIYLQYT
jgi:hypothetical protein